MSFLHALVTDREVDFIFLDVADKTQYKNIGVDIDEAFVSAEKDRLPILSVNR